MSARSDDGEDEVHPRADDEAEDASAWARRAVDAHDWKSLAAVFSSRDFSDEKSERMGEARPALIEAGPQAVGDIIDELSRKGGTGKDDLTKILLEIGDPRAVRPILDVFNETMVRATGGLQDEIVEFFARVGATDVAVDLVPFLDDDYELTRWAAAHGLGLLAVEETRPALVTAMERHGSSVTNGLRDAHTEFARDLVAGVERQRKAAGPDVRAMSDQEMRDALLRLCDAYEHDDESQIERLEPLATDIGEELDRRGGIDEMRRVFSVVEGRTSARTLERHWSGIGAWWG